MKSHDQKCKRKTPYQTWWQRFFGAMTYCDHCGAREDCECADKSRKEA